MFCAADYEVWMKTQCVFSTMNERGMNCYVAFGLIKQLPRRRVRKTINNMGA